MLFLHWECTEAVYLALPNLDYLALPFYIEYRAYLLFSLRKIPKETKYHESTWAKFVLHLNIG